MNDEEKIIKGLECCSKYPNEYGDCLGGDCPYRSRIECHKELLQDAIAILKAQEPKVMTLEEVRKWEQPDVWMEFRKDGTIEPTSRLGFATIDAVVTNGTVNPPVTMIDGYGITWRCWTSRPTDEQRKAVKWDASTHKEP